MMNGVDVPTFAEPTDAVKHTPALLNFSPTEVETKHTKNVGLELLGLSAMLSALVGKKGRLTLSVQECPEGEVALSPIGLTKVLINLVRNSSEAVTARGHIAVAAQGLLEDAGRRSILISVEDNGLAIPLSLLEKIFDSEAPLELQGDADSPRVRVRSRRLGLRVVRDLVEDAGGRVRARRLPERGSRFEIILPVLGSHDTGAGPERTSLKLQDAVA